MADAPRVLRESAAKATVTQHPSSRPPPVTQPTTPASTPPSTASTPSFWHRLLHGDPDNRRSKSERVHESSGYWRGVAHAAPIFLTIGLAAMFFAFLGAAPILADLQGRLAAIDAAKAEMGR